MEYNTRPTSYFDATNVCQLHDTICSILAGNFIFDNTVLSFPLGRPKTKYSHLFNKRGGWNKHGGWDFLEKN